MTVRPTLTCFKNNDIRGVIGDEIDEAIAYKIGRAFGIYLLQELAGTQKLEGQSMTEPLRSVAIGRDNRLTSESYKDSLVKGLLDSGVDVIDLGITGTEQVYFSVQSLNTLGGLQVTASHNPINYNGMKLVGRNAKPISKHSGFSDIQSLVESSTFPEVNQRGTLTSPPPHLLSTNDSQYIQHLLSYISPSKIIPLTIVVNAGNGVAGIVVNQIEAQFKALNIPVELVKVHNKSDGTFPNGIPNPLLPECRQATSTAVKTHQADFGVAWDGDFDRCFLFDEKGQFIEGYYIVGLLAEAFLKKEPHSNILHDARLIWNTIDIVTENNGTAHMVKAGHSLIKEKMIEFDAVYGGEMSAHHYFRDFGYCDSGMIPWLLISELVSKSQKSLSQITQSYIQNYPSSGEINLKVENVDKVMARVLKTYKDGLIDQTDGVSIDMGDWRFNLRKSNTEPLIRLNVESRGCDSLMQEQTQKLLSLLSE